MARKFQIKRGLKAGMPTLAQGELAMTTDSGSEGLFIGTGTENIEIAKKSDLNISDQIGTHNSNSSAHSDIRESITTHTSNASIHVTDDERNAWNAKLDSYTETDPTVPAWAKAESKPSYTASEVGADPSGSASQALTDAKSYTDTQIAAIPTPDVSGQISTHNSDSAAHSDIRKSITTHTGNTSIHVTAGQKTAWDAKATTSYVDQKIAAIPTPDVSGQINTHNTNASAHNDIRELITGLTTRLNTLADSDDTTLDQLSEIVAYIKNNKSLIDGITTSKVNVADIIDNLTTNVSNKPLSAAQGVALKALIDAITVPTKVSELTNDSGYLTSFTETDPTVPAWAKAESKPSYTASEVGAVPTSRTVNGKALSSDVTLSASDVGARPSSWTPSASDVGAGPTARKVNGKALSSDITLSASDVGLGNVGNFKAVSTVASQGLTDTEKSNARANIGAGTSSLTIGTTASTAAAGNHTHTAANVGAVPTSRTVNGKALSTDITLSASDVGARPSSWTPSVSDVGAVPTSRTVNGKALSANITLAASDVGAAPASHTSDSTVHVTAEEKAAWNAKADAPSYGTEDLKAGTSSLETGKLYFVYE